MLPRHCQAPGSMQHEHEVLRRPVPVPVTTYPAVSSPSLTCMSLKKCSRYHCNSSYWLSRAIWTAGGITFDGLPDVIQRSAIENLINNVVSPNRAYAPVAAFSFRDPKIRAPSFTQFLFGCDIEQHKHQTLVVRTFIELTSIGAWSMR